MDNKFIFIAVDHGFSLITIIIPVCNNNCTITNTDTLGVSEIVVSHLPLNMKTMIVNAPLVCHVMNYPVVLSEVLYDPISVLTQFNSSQG